MRPPVAICGMAFQAVILKVDGLEGHPTGDVGTDNTQHSALRTST